MPAPAEVAPEPSSFDSLVRQIARLPPRAAAEALAPLPDAEVVRVLQALSPPVLCALLAADVPERESSLRARLPEALRTQWELTRSHAPGTVGALMRPPVGVLPETLRVADAIEALRRLVAGHLITYLYPVDQHGRLQGVVVLRDLFLARPEQTLADIMLRAPFTLPPDLPALEAMKQVVTRHFPVYPVCESDGRLVGLIRGEALFENQAIAISAIPGRMVGVRTPEGPGTPFGRSLRDRSPWLLANLVLSLGSAAVITYYRDAVQALVLLAVFLPVIAAQARNSGAQTMAIALRGLTQGEWTARDTRRILGKETLLGLATGTVVGGVAGALIGLQALYQEQPAPLGVGLVLGATMALSCALSGAAGVTVPLLLRRLGADPALASSIILSTITSIVSQALFLGAAAWLLL